MTKIYVIILVFFVSITFGFSQVNSNINLLPKTFHITKVKEFYAAEILGKGYTFLQGNAYDDEGGLLIINYERKLINLQLLRPADLRNIEENIEQIEINDKSAVILTNNYKVILYRVYSIGDINAFSIRFLYAFSNQLDQYTKFVLLNAAVEKTELEKKLDQEVLMKPKDEDQLDSKSSIGSSYSLDGRSAQSLPKPYYTGNEEGIIVVQVTVDKNGLVTKAEPGAKGSNTKNPELFAASKKAALQAKFNADSNASENQVGTVTYRFILDEF